jgi:hypothetical protein
VLAVKASDDGAGVPTEGARELHDLVAGAPPRAEMESVTENGTVARFEMAYSPPNRAEVFGPPLRQRIASMLFLTFGVVLATLVAVAYYAASSNSALYRWIVEGDRGRPLPASVLAFFIVLSGVGTLVRARMRGVIVHPDGIEGRYLLAMGVPRVKRWAWPQIERIVLDDHGAMLDLWDGTYERLPDVARPREMGELLERIAGTRRIVVTRLADIAER